MEEHLSLTMHQLINTQRHLASLQAEAVKRNDELTLQFSHDVAFCRQQLATAITTDDHRASQQQMKKATHEEIVTLQLEPIKNKVTQQLAAAQQEIFNSTQKSINFLLLFLSISIVLLAVFIHFKDIKIEDNLSFESTIDENIKHKLAQKLYSTVTDFNTSHKQNLTKTVKETLSKLQVENSNISNATQKKTTELDTEQKTPQINQLSKWKAKIISNASKLSSGDQVVPVIVKMSDYTKKKTEIIDWYSDPFYTHHKGYKMCLNVFASGLNSPHLTVWLHLIKGSYDNHLKWPLKGRCEIKLLNQVSNCKHHCEVGVIESGDKQPSVHKKHYIWYNYEFISHENLEISNSSCQYLKDDALFFQVQCKLD